MGLLNANRYSRSPPSSTARHPRATPQERRHKAARNDPRTRDRPNGPSGNRSTALPRIKRANRARREPSAAMLGPNRAASRGDKHHQASTPLSHRASTPLSHRASTRLSHRASTAFRQGSMRARSRRCKGGGFCPAGLYGLRRPGRGQRGFFFCSSGLGQCAFLASHLIMPPLPRRNRQRCAVVKALPGSPCTTSKL